MLRGVNRQVIEINETGNKYFEKAVLYVNSEFPETNDNELYQLAENYLKTLTLETKIKSAKKSKNRKKFIGVLSSILFATVSLILILLLI